MEIKVFKLVVISPPIGVCTESTTFPSNLMVDASKDVPTTFHMRGKARRETYDMKLGDKVMGEDRRSHSRLEHLQVFMLSYDGGKVEILAHNCRI